MLFPDYLKANPESEQLVRSALAYMLQITPVDTGNLPSAMDEVSGQYRRPSSDILVHWCHGATGTCLSMWNLLSYGEEAMWLSKFDYLWDIFAVYLVQWLIFFRKLPIVVTNVSILYHSGASRAPRNWTVLDKVFYSGKNLLLLIRVWICNISDAYCRLNRLQNDAIRVDVLGGGIYVLSIW